MRLSDTGNYTCQVFNKYGNLNATFALNVFNEEADVQQPPKLVQKTVVVGEEAVLECHLDYAAGNALPSIKWMKQISKAEYAKYVLQNSLEAGHDEASSEFYQSNTPPAPIFWPKLNQNRQLEAPSSFYSLNDLIGANNLNAQLDNLKGDSLLMQRRSIKPQEEESVHYITLGSSLTAEQRLLFSSDENVYVSRLTLKQVNTKDSGLYVCFSNGKSFAKFDLNVVNRQFTFIEQEKKDSTQIDSIQTNLQSTGLLFVLIPIFLIASFAIASICYLKKLNQRRNKKIINKNISLNPFKQCLSYCCTKRESSSLKSNIKGLNKFETCQSTNKSCNTNSLSGNSFSDTSSTTVTTSTPYYATVPLLAAENIPPPPLPNSQPPTHHNLDADKCLERAVSTPSVAYYKIVDLFELENQQQLGVLPDHDTDNHTCVSTSSRIYYQLAPAPRNNAPNEHTCPRRNFNNFYF